MAEKTVPIEDAREQARRASLRLGLLHIYYAKTLVEELGEERGKQIILKAIKEYGRHIGEDGKNKACAKGLENEPANYDPGLPLYGMNDRMEKTEVNKEKVTRVYGCVMADIWKQLGENELGGLYCYVDPAQLMAFNPNYKMYHLKSIPGGDEYCEIAVKPTTEQERRDFADRDARTDWSYIDKKEG